jgi:hypothetical protein
MTGLESLLDCSSQCAGLFRLGRDVEAALLMVEFFDELQLSIVGAEPVLQKEWAHLLAQMLDCQEAQNWLGLADFLEYELVGLIEAVMAG